MSEKLSNLLDKNISQSELDEFLAAYRKDPELAQRWQRYHSVQDLLNNQISDTDLQFDVTAKVMAKVSDDPNPAIDSDTNIEPDSNIVEFPTDNSPSKSPSMKKPWWPVAIAASMLLGLYVLVQKPALEPVVENQLAQSSDEISTPHWQTDSAAIEDALNALLVEHSEFTGVTGMNGLGSYSKFVSYQKL